MGTMWIEEFWLVFSSYKLFITSFHFPLIPIGTFSQSCCIIRKWTSGFYLLWFTLMSHLAFCNSTEKAIRSAEMKWEFYRCFLLYDFFFKKVMTDIFKNEWIGWQILACDVMQDIYCWKSKYLSYFQNTYIIKYIQNAYIYSCWKQIPSFNAT